MPRCHSPSLSPVDSLISPTGLGDATRILPAGRCYWLSPLAPSHWGRWLPPWACVCRRFHPYSKREVSSPLLCFLRRDCWTLTCEVPWCGSVLIWDYIEINWKLNSQIQTTSERLEQNDPKLKINCHTLTLSIPNSQMTQQFFQLFQWMQYCSLVSCHSLKKCYKKKNIKLTWDPHYKVCLVITIQGI